MKAILCRLRLTPWSLGNSFYTEGSPWLVHDPCPRTLDRWGHDKMLSSLLSSQATRDRTTDGRNHICSSNHQSASSSSS